MAQTPTLWADLGIVNSSDNGPGGDAQEAPSITALSNGNFVVVWTDKSHTGSDLTHDSVKFQIFNAMGEAIGTEQVVHDGSNGLDELDPDVAATPDGGFVISVTRDFVTDTDIRAFGYDASGTMVSTIFVAGAVGVSESGSKIIIEPDQFVASDYKIAVMYVRDNGEGGSESVSLRRFTKDGTLINTVEFTSNPDNQGSPAVSLRSNGQVVALFRDEDGGSDDDLFLRIINKTSPNQVVPLSNSLTGKIGGADIAGLTNGNMAVVYEDLNGTLADSNGSGIFLEVLDASGALVSSTTVNTTKLGNQSDPQVTALSAQFGGFFVSWFDTTTQTTRGQVFDNAGDEIGSEIEIDNGNTVFQPSITGLSDGRIAISYTSLDLGGNRDIEVRILDPRGATINGDAAANVLTSRLDGATINGLAGDDRIFGLDAIDVVMGGAGIDTITGRGGDDRLFGNDQNDRLFGENGNDRLEGGNHNDLLDGGANNDTLLGGNDNDVLRGQSGNDSLDGGSGNDQLDGGLHNDILEGGRGNDTLIGGLGVDDFVFRSGFGRDTIRDFNARSGGEDINLKAVRGIKNYKDLVDNHMKQAGKHVIIKDGTNTIKILDTKIGQLDPGDFIF